MKTAFFNCFVTQIKGNLNCVMFLPMKLQFPLTYAIIGIGSTKNNKRTKQNSKYRSCSSTLTSLFQLFI